MQRGIAILAACFAALGIPAVHAGTVSNPVFTDYTILSSNAELARRMLSPLTSVQLPQILAQQNAKMSVQPVDLAQEQFALFVPTTQPPQGYGLIVFVPPWDDARVPATWQPVLDEDGFVFVSAARSGNETTALGRREPLALLAEYNVAKRYRIDPKRIYVAGFSGGARIAMRLALGYPDVFRGAILNSGGDPIGTAIVPLPPKDLFQQFQSSSRLVYFTGSRDIFVMNADMASIQSMREWCQFNVEHRIMQSAGHQLIDATMLSRALDLLSQPIAPDEALASCRAGIDVELSTKLNDAETLIASGNRERAQNALKDVDARFGGLAAPKSVELSNALSSK